MAEVSSSRRKCRKAHFSAPSHIKRKLMSAPLSKDLKKKYGVRSMPVRKDDELLIRTGYYSINAGTFKGNKGKVTSVYRKRWCVYIEKLSKSKANGAPYNIPIKPCNCSIVKLKLDKNRNELLKKKAQTVTEKGKGEKYSKDTMKQVD